MSANSSVLSKKEEKAKNIQVVVRCRPFNTAERKTSHGVIDCDHGRREVNVRTAGVNDKAARKTYTFDMVFGPSAKQIEVYRSVVCPILDEVIMGYNCTVFAYGQTGTGKTFTMEGERSPNGEFTWDEDPLAGIIPRTLHQIFEKLSENGTEFSVKVSLLEIYNEELFDLLSPSPDVTERLQMFDDPRNKRGVIIKGLEEITVHNKDEVYQILERGAAKRKTASTLMNAYSSRSHSVFSVTIHMKEMTLDGEELVKIGKLNLVDLAGSENIGRSGAVDKRAREAGNINQSLLTLGRVITSLVERAPHVPYRESKLTRILQDSLGGRTKTSIIATVSPASINLEETLSTLEYANRAKNIMNKPEVNQKLTKKALIKEYTEEIERLKRDLAAARDKNGIYLSTENYDTMSNKIVCQEERITEFTEKISALEEEMKRVTDMFSDSRRELEQCGEELREVRQWLEEARRELGSTRARLTEEEFMVSQLECTESQLYGTAGQLLTTVEVTTRDVCGLHEKLDRKKAVEQHNVEVQTDFAGSMEATFDRMQRALEEQSHRQQEMLSLYSASIGNLLNLNSTSFSEVTSAITVSFKSIKDLISKSVARCQAGLSEQELLCQTAKDGLQQVLEEHKLEMEEGLLAIILPGLNAVDEINNTMKQTLKSSCVLAEKVEAMKQEMASFFGEQASAMATMQRAALEQLRSLQVEQRDLKERIEKADAKHTTGMSQVISCLQNQLNLLALETRNDFKELLSQADAVQVPVGTLQQSIQLQCGEAAQRASARQELLESSADRLIAEARCAAEMGERAAEESSGQCSYLAASVGQLAEKAARRCEVAAGNAALFAEGQLSLVRARKAASLELEQCVEASCGEAIQELSSQLQVQQARVEEELTTLEKHVVLDEATLHQQRTQLSSHATEALAKVNAFLKDELRRDIPTGQTPQRKDYTYPRVLAKTKDRQELLQCFRQQNQALQEALSTCETVKEEQVVEQDSLEDEVSTCSDGVITEQSLFEENVVCSENGRAPFFKRKRVGKKENKSLDQSKTENERPSTPLPSRLPLRPQN